MKECRKKIGEKFGVQIETPGRKTTAYYGLMAKVAKFLLDIDVFLLTYLSIKVKLHHLVHQDSLADFLFLDEETGVEGDAGGQIKAYLRDGKELILSSLHSVSERAGFDVLMQDLTALMNKTDRAISESLTLEGIACITIAEIDLIRLLHELWNFFAGTSGRSIKMSVASLADAPRVLFAAEPPFSQWLEPIGDDQPKTGFFTLVSSNFEDPRKWRARLMNTGGRNPVEILIKDPLFFESIQSSIRNAANGLLIGDVLEAKYRINYDQIADETAYEIVFFKHRFRANEVLHQAQLDLN